MSTDHARAPGYSIRTASKLTGISADTLRMWERRYGFPKPARSDSGQRVYVDADIERLRWITRALAAGYRAGDVVRRTTPQLRRLVEPTSSVTSSIGPMEALRAGDAQQLERALDEHSEGISPARFVTELATPLVTEVGAAVKRGELAARHEQLLLDLLSTRARLQLAPLDDLAGSPLLSLCTVRGEEQRIGIDLCALYATAIGATVRVAGIGCPPSLAVDVAMALRARAVVVPVLVPRDIDRVSDALQQIAAALPARIELWALMLDGAAVAPRDANSGSDWSWLGDRLANV